MPHDLGICSFHLTHATPIRPAPKKLNPSAEATSIATSILCDAIERAVDNIHDVQPRSTSLNPSSIAPLKRVTKRSVQSMHGSLSKKLRTTKDEKSKEKRLDDVFAKFIAKRLKYGDRAPCEGATLRIRPVSSLVPTFRLFRGFHDMSKFLSHLCLILHGAVITQLPWKEIDTISFMEIVPAVSFTLERILRIGVDIGRLRLLNSYGFQCYINIRDSPS